MSAAARAGAGAPVQAAWQAPTDVGLGLYEAGARGDWGAYCDVLAGTFLYPAMSRTAADADLGSVTTTPHSAPSVVIG